jgi:hypothetical protein
MNPLDFIDFFDRPLGGVIAAGKLSSPKRNLTHFFFQESTSPLEICCEYLGGMCKKFDMKFLDQNCYV